MTTNLDNIIASLTDVSKAEFIRSASDSVLAHIVRNASTETILALIEASPTAKAAGAPKPSGKAAKKTRGGKATDDDKTKVLVFVRSNPGKTGAGIISALGMDGPVVSHALKRLVKSGFLVTEGRNRATTYGPKSGSTDDAEESDAAE